MRMSYASKHTYHPPWHVANKYLQTETGIWSKVFSLLTLWLVSCESADSG